MLKEQQKNHKVKYTKCFWEELDDISEYMLDNLYLSTSLKFVDKVFDTIDYLTLFPKMYAVYYDNNKYRKFIVGNYIIFYNVDDQDDLVSIIHIYFSRKISFNLS